MLRLKFVLVSLCCMGFSLVSKATHNRAGEITYKWLYGFTYEIKVTTYTNIGSSGLADRCQDTVYFGDGSHATVNRSNGLSTICAGFGNDGVPINFTIKLNEYVTMHTYPGPGNYIISMEDPNRNAGIVNVPNSVNQVFYIESLLVISTSGSTHNDSPILTFPPIDKGCLTQCFYHNPGAYDTDGDSLSYELTYCRGTGGAICPGYAYPANGGGTFKVDSVTGTLTWCTPQLQGEYNLAMYIKEWRMDASNHYVLIGYVIRDLQVDIGTCNNNDPDVVNIADTCVVATSNLIVNVSANDPDGNVLTLTANGEPFHTGSTSSTFTSTPAASSVNGTFSWTPDLAAIRRIPYQVTIKAEDSNPQINLVHFNTFTIKVLPDGPINLSTTPSNDFIVLKWNKPSTYSTTGNNKLFRYMVYRKTGLSNWVHSNKETIPPAYTGFTFLGYSNNSVNDTILFDFNSGNPFTPAQDYSYVVLAQYDDGSTSYVSNIASSQIYVGIKEIGLANSDISISPNPVTETALVSFNKPVDGSCTIELVDVTGRNMRTFVTDRSSVKQNTYAINMEDFNSGIYFIKIIHNDQIITKKIIKQ